jgi:hypothetical protein
LAVRATDAVPGRRLRMRGAAAAGHRHGRRTRSLTGTFGRTEIAIPCARIFGADGKTAEWKSKAVLAYQRRTRAADALIASAYLSLQRLNCAEDFSDRWAQCRPRLRSPYLAQSVRHRRCAIAIFWLRRYT